MELIALLIALASLILHYVAPRTKTTVDDKALVIVEKAQVLLPKQEAPAVAKGVVVK